VRLLWTIFLKIKKRRTGEWKHLMRPIEGDEAHWLWGH
jgi:hypothetical protein